MNPALSTYQRTSYLEKMSESPLDILIIGGGVTGAGIAMDASLRGLTVGLVEMQDFAAGTSSRSTKLIHGGLRYLKQGEIKLVQEVGRERALLFKNAPHIVKPSPMLLPLYKGGTYGKLATSIGLYVYDRLAGVERRERRKMLSRKATLELEPSLKPDGLKGGGLYVEYMTDDARLTMEIIKTARKQGALPVNYVKALHFLYEDGRVKGIRVRDLLKQKEYDLYAKKIVNAAGPWVDDLRRQDNSLNEKRLHLTKGVHLVFSKSRFPLKNAVYFDTPDGRMIFAIPRGNTTYAGTTDTDYKGDIRSPLPLEEDRDYILEAINAMFPSVRLTPNDVISSWAGLRPLIHQEGKGPSELSRKDEIFHSPTGLITIAGGKLTGFRKMAEKVVDLVCHELSQETGAAFPACPTDQVIISGGDTDPSVSFSELQAQRIEQGVKKGIPRETCQYFVHLYGSNAESIFTRLQPLLEKNRDNSALRAQIQYSIEEEMCAALDDFLVRRTGHLFFHPDYCQSHLGQAAELMGESLGWTNEEKTRQIMRMTDLMKQAAINN